MRPARAVAALWGLGIEFRSENAKGRKSGFGGGMTETRRRVEKKDFCLEMPVASKSVRDTGGSGRSWAPGSGIRELRKAWKRASRVEVASFEITWLGMGWSERCLWRVESWAE